LSENTVVNTNVIILFLVHLMKPVLDVTIQKKIAMCWKLIQCQKVNAMGNLIICNVIPNLPWKLHTFTRYYPIHRQSMEAKAK